MKPSEMPYNLDAEESVIASCLIDPQAFRLIRPLLSSQAFFREPHVWTWEALARLDDAGTAVDLVSVSEALGARLDKAGGISWLTGLMLKVPTAVHAEHYARIVRKKAAQRTALAQAERIARAAYDDLDEDELTALAYSAANEIAQEAPIHEPKPAADIARRAYDRFERRHFGTEPVGIPTPSTDLTRILGGWKSGELVIVAGRPAMGKTSFSTLALKRAAEAGERGLMFELEMSDVDLMDRLAAEQSGVNLERIRDGLCSEEEFEAVSAAYSVLGRLPFDSDDAGSLTPERARATIARWKARHPDLALVVVDYAQRMRSGRTREIERYREIGEAAMQLKETAREFDLCVLLVASVGRGCEARENKRPMLSDLRESGNLEYEADVVIFVYRDEVYNRNCDRPGVAELVVAKHRNGRLGLVEMHFDKTTGRWGNLERLYDDDDAPPPTRRAGRNGRERVETVGF